MTENYRRAMTVDCPTCLRPAGQPCIYVMDHWGHRAGELTAIAHGERSQRSTARLQKIAHNERRDQLRAWLQAYGDIFQVGAS